MDSWHNSDCQRPDVRSIGSIVTCVACGSTESATAETASLSSSRDGDGSTTWADSDAFSDGEHEASYSPSSPNGFERAPSAFVNSRQRASYAHEQLGENSIRLLSIEPGQFVDDLSCRLSPESLNSLPIYDAISYTWADDSGDRERNKTIRIGDKPYKVTTSCHLALRRARLLGYLTVWIDAVCINQDNANERNHQVRLMAQIYANARSVMAYIGEESPRSRWVISRITTGSIMDADIVAELLSRPYFWRVWVLQEIALARKATLVCGDATIPWSEFATQIQGLRVFSEAAISALLTRPPPHVTYGFTDSGVSQWPSPCNNQGQVSGVPLALTFDAPKFRTINQLPQLLDLASFCEATDPRDKVYALLGLTTGTEGYRFFPDYDSDLEGVYTKTAILIAASCGVLPLLVRAVCRRSISSALPWVPDWRSHSPISPSTPSDEVSLLDQMRQEVDQAAGFCTPLSIDINTATSVHFDAIPVCSFLDIFVSKMIAAAQFFPAQNSPEVGLLFSPVPQRNVEEAILPRLAELSGSLWLFQVRPRLPGLEKDACIGCFDGYMMLSLLPPGFDSTEVIESVLELPFLGLIKFWAGEGGSQETGCWINGRCSIRARLSTQPPERDIPSTRNLARLGVVSVPAERLKTWRFVPKLLQMIEESLDDLQKWQDRSLSTWRDSHIETPSWALWPAVLWGSWIQSRLRGFKLQTTSLPLESNGKQVEPNRGKGAPLDQQWQELQRLTEGKLYSANQERWIQTQLPQGRSPVSPQSIWIQFVSRWEPEVELLEWRTQVDEGRRLRKKLVADLKTLQTFYTSWVQIPERDQQQEWFLQQWAEEFQLRLHDLIVVPEQWIREEVRTAEHQAEEGEEGKNKEPKENRTWLQQERRWKAQEQKWREEERGRRERERERQNQQTGPLGRAMNWLLG